MTLPLIEPVIPVLRKHVPRGPRWRYEPKLDGFRGVFYFDGTEAWFRSKTKRKMTRFRFLAAALAKQLGRVESLILDGEILVMGEHGPDFYALMQSRGEPQYAAFDLLWLDGRDFRPEPYAKRKSALKRLLQRVDGIGYVDTHRSASLYEAAIRMDLEGILAKRADQPYGAATEWIKIKHPGYSQAEGRAELFQR